MPDIFVSYKSDDRERVEPLVDALRRSGLSVWWDRDIPPSAPWEASITEALNNASCVIVCWTEQSVHPKFGAKVQVESREAADGGKLLQVLLEKVQAPLFFRQAQALDLSNWRGNQDFGPYQQLVQAARDVVAGREPSLPNLTTQPARRGGGNFLPMALMGAVFATIVIGGFWFMRPLLLPASPAQQPQQQQTDTATAANTATTTLATTMPAASQARHTETAPAPATTIAATEPPPPAVVPHGDAPHPGYSGNNYTAELDSCTLLNGGAECTVYITPQGHATWWFDNRSYLADQDGNTIPAVEMSIGSDTRNVQSLGYQVVFDELQVRTKIVYRFVGNITPSDIQALVIAVGAPLTRRSATLQPIPWR
jgi:hypothetical protein